MQVHAPVPSSDAAAAAAMPVAGPWIPRRDGMGFLRRNADRMQLITVRFEESDGRGGRRACCYWVGGDKDLPQRAETAALAFQGADENLGAQGYVLTGGFEVALAAEQQRVPPEPRPRARPPSPIRPMPPIAEVEAELRRRLRAIEALKALPAPDSVFGIQLLGSDGAAEVLLRDGDSVEDDSTFNVVREAVAVALRLRRTQLEATAFGV